MRAKWMLPPRALAVVTAAALGLTPGCASTGRHEEAPSETAPTPTETAPGLPAVSRPAVQAPAAPAAESTTLAALQARIHALEEKVQAQQATIDQFVVSQKTIVSGVGPHAAEASGIAVQDLSASATQAGDPALDLYRKGSIALESEKFSEAQGFYTNFVQQYPDHALAAAAQFYAAECAMRLKDVGTAKTEYQKILIAHDRSSYVPDALGRLAELEPEGQSKQLLLSLFPASPPALALMRVKSASAMPVDPTPPAPEVAPQAEPEKAVPAALAPVDPSPEEDMAIVP